MFVKDKFHRERECKPMNDLEQAVQIIEVSKKGTAHAAAPAAGAPAKHSSLLHNHTYPLFFKERTDLWSWSLKSPSFNIIPSTIHHE
jgi:hypothetical protein